MERTTQRRAFIFGLGSFVLASLGIAGAQKVLSPYQGRSTIGIAPTEKAYFNYQPELSSGENTLWATLITSEMDVNNLVNHGVIPDYLEHDLDIDYNSDFWVAVVAILPSNSDFSLGRGYFDEGTLDYPEATYRIETRDPIASNQADTSARSGPQIESLESGQRLKQSPKYHYVFHRWTQALPFAEPPSEVTVSWS